MLFACGLPAIPVFAQQEVAAEELEEYRLQAEELVNFLEFAMNTVGTAEAAAAEKDIIINQSYTKLFRDEKVQVEDDLDERRDVVTNKDVQAYLKDIDFFFKDVQFEFNISDISHYLNENGQLFFKVTADRNMQGVTIDNDTINSNKVRYIEINLDRLNRDLKIASIYTTRLSEEEELATWWNNMSYEWQATFKREQAILEDTLSLGQVKQLVELRELDLSGNDMITSLEPLAQLAELRVLNISGTQIDDLTPIRNLTRLEVLQVSNTTVTTLEPLKYASSLQELHIDGTLVSDLSPVRNFRRLQRLYAFTLPLQSIAPLQGMSSLQDLRIHDTPIADGTVLSTLPNLEMLQISYTRIDNLAPLASLAKLERLYIDNTGVTDLGPLSSASSLRILFCDNTRISTLAPLEGLASLERVYCDNTPVTREEASRFMGRNPDVLVIFNSTRLGNWWSQLPGAWVKVFRKMVSMDEVPTKEQLQTVANLAVVNISGNTEIATLDPLRDLMSLKKLYAANTNINDLEPVKNLLDLQLLEVSSTPLTGTALEPLKGLVNLSELYFNNTNITALPHGNFDALQVLNMENTHVSSLEPLVAAGSIKTVYCDNTEVSEAEAVAFAGTHPQTLVVFRTERLKDWWRALPPEWQQVFGQAINLAGSPTREQLHRITSFVKINIENNPDVRNVEPLRVFTNLKELIITGTRINQLEPLRELVTLEYLECSRSPVNNLEPLSGLRNLRYLSVENTGVEELDPLSGLRELQTLKCSGTQVRDLDPLEAMVNLVTLECDNTDVKKLKPLSELPRLELLVVYNTRVSSGRIRRFKEAQPGCEVVYY